MTVPAVHAHRGSPDPATGIRREHPRGLLPGPAPRGRRGRARRPADRRRGPRRPPRPGRSRASGPIHELRVRPAPRVGPARWRPPWRPVEGLTVNIEVKNLPGEPGFDPDERWPGRSPSWWWRAGRATSVVVSSFWPGSLDAVAEARPELATGLLVARWFDPAGMRAAWPLDTGARRVHPHASLVDEALVAEARRAGLSVAAWTVNDRPRLDAVGGPRGGHGDHRRRGPGARRPRPVPDDRPLGLDATAGAGRPAVRPVGPGRRS